MSAKDSTSLLSFRSRKQMSMIEDKLTKIGIGMYQYLAIPSVSMAFFSEAAQLASLSLTAVIIKSDWDITDTGLGILGVLFLGSMSIGAVISAVLSDDYGRLKFIRISLCCCCLFTIPIILSNNYWVFTVHQSVLGFTNGLSVPIVVPYILEICPHACRSMYVVLSQLMFVIGELYVIILSLIFIPDLTSSGWRSVYIGVSVALLVGFVLVAIFPRESVFFLLNKGRNEESIKIVKYAAAMNKAQTLTQSDYESLSNYIAPLRARDFSKFKELFQIEYMAVTVLLMILWSISEYIIIGFLFSIRIILDFDENGSDSIQVLLTGIAVQIPVVLLCVWLVQNEYIGRRLILIVCWFLLSAVSLVGTLAVDSNLIIPVSFVMIILIGINFNIIFPYTCEIYHTRVRVMGLGFHTIVSRAMAASAPILFIKLTLHDDSLSMLLISALSLIAFGVTLLLPYETKGKQFDVPNERTNIKQDY